MSRVTCRASNVAYDFLRKDIRYSVSRVLTSYELRVLRLMLLAQDPAPERANANGTGLRAAK